MRNKIFEDFFDDVEIEHDEIEDISSNYQHCYFKFTNNIHTYSHDVEKDKKFDIYTTYAKLRTAVDLLTFTKDVEIEIYATEVWTLMSGHEPKERKEIKPTSEQRYIYELFGKQLNPKIAYAIEIEIVFDFNKISYSRFVREMHKFFLNVKTLNISHSFELGNIETGKTYPEVITTKNISDEMMQDYFKCFCPNGSIDVNSKDIIYNRYISKFENILNDFILKSSFTIELKKIERKKYTQRETNNPDCLFVHLYYNIPRGQKFQRQDVYVDMRKIMFDYIPRIFAINFNICFLITSSKPFETDYTLYGEPSRTKGLGKGSLEHVSNMASGSRREISTFYVFKAMDKSNANFYMAFLNKNGKLLNGRVEFHTDMRWAYLFQHKQ